MEKFTTLREEFESETGAHAFADQKYIEWLEGLVEKQRQVKNCSIPDVVATEGKCCDNFTPYSKLSKWDDCQRCDCTRNEH